VRADHGGAVGWRQAGQCVALVRQHTRQAKVLPRQTAVLASYSQPQGPSLTAAGRCEEGKAPWRGMLMHLFRHTQI